MKSEEASLYQPRFTNQWEKIYLYDLAEWVNGLAFKPADFYSSGLPVIKIAEIKSGITHQTKYSNKNIDKRYLINSGDMLFSWSGQPETSIDTFIWQGMQGWLNQHIFKVIPNHEKLSVDYLYLLLKYLKPNFIKIASNKQTTGLGHITKADLLKIEVAIPDKNIQNKIISAIKPIDDRINLLRETNATLEAIAQALFKSWFVDFDPVRAKAEGREPEGMSAAIADLFPSEFEETELGEMPKGWSFGTVEGLCQVITNGGTPSRANSVFWDGGTVPWFKTGEFRDGFLLTPSERITEDAIKQSSAGLLPKNAILMAIYAAPTVGRLGILTEPASFNQACTGMVAKAEVGPWFLYWTLYFGRTWFNSRANGAAQQNISKAIVASYKTINPPAEVLAAFNEVAGSLHERVLSCSEQILTLTRLRDTLLPRLMSGKLRIPDLEEQAA